MNSLGFLIVKTLKNRVLEVFRKPMLLLMYGLVIGAIISVFFMGQQTSGLGGEPLSLVWLQAILFGIFLLLFVIFIEVGFKKGNAIFQMNDVNFLFVSPMNPRSILLYGVIRMMGSALFSGFFILFQGSSLALFGINMGGLFLILLGFSLNVMLIQLLSLLIYSLTNGRPKRKLLARSVIFLLFLPILGRGLWNLMNSNGAVLPAIEATFHGPVSSWTPVVGWASDLVVALLLGDVTRSGLFLGVILSVGAGLVAMMMKINPDYYEDVLAASETVFEKKRALAENGVSAVQISTKTIKAVSKPLKGSGASALFHKHVRESFRTNPLGLWGYVSIFSVGGVWGVAMLMSKAGMGAESFFVLLQFLIWFQLFLVGTGRGMLETYNHYIYMMPVSSFSKILWSNLEVILKVVVESVVMFGGAGLIVGAHPLVILGGIMTYVAFTLMLMAINYLSMRWLGASINNGILVMIYMLVVMILLAPGLVAALIVGFTFSGWGPVVALGILALWELFVALICFWISKGILHNCDMPIVKMMQPK